MHLKKRYLMIWIHNIILCVSFTLWSICAHGQFTAAIHFDRPFYTNGESVYFKVYLPPAFGAHKALLRVSVWDTGTNQCMEDFHLSVQEDGNGYGHFKVPHTYQADFLKVYVSAFNEKNEKFSDVISADISILKVDAEEVVYPVLSSNADDSYEDLKMQIEIEKQQYAPRQKVNVMVKVMDRHGNPVRSGLSISVSHQPFFDTLPPPVLSFKMSTYSDHFSPENKIVLQRKAIDANLNQPISNSIFSFFMQEEGFIKTLHTDAQGNFIIELPPFYGKRTLQFVDHFGRNISVMEENEKMEDEQVEFADGGEGFDTLAIKNHLRESRQRKKINFLFRQPADTVLSTTQTNHWPFQADFTVYMDDYESAKDLKEFLDMIITPLRIHRSSEKLVPKMVNPLNKPFFPDEPLFIIDHSIELNVDKAIAIDLDNVKCIDFYNTPETISNFGYLGRNGVVAIYTEYPLLYRTEKVEIIKGLQPEPKYPVQLPEYWPSRVPAINPLVYWNPFVETNSAGKAHVSFVQTDDIGVFMIEVSAQDVNGIFGTARSYYHVSTF